MIAKIYLTSLCFSSKT